ncbi:MAG: sigma-70 family RNA polymerase sigma factor [Bacteroidia bacterium]|nr:sigma-70 family RNA polymerase sigma factor [Bacteroidia bacterium]
MFDLPDKKIITGILKKDPFVFKYIYNHYFPVIRKMVLLNSGSEQDAEDMLQESLFILYNKIKNKIFDTSISPKSFIYITCFFLWKNILRNRKGELQNMKNYSMCIDNLELMDYKDVLSREYLYYLYFDRLSKICQKILTLYVNEYSMEEIARLTEFGSAKQTHNKKIYCQKQLAGMIKKNPLYCELTI